MEELIIVSFFKMLPEIFRFEMGFPWSLIMLVVFLAGVVFEIVLLRKNLSGWVLPLSFLAGEVCCEIFWQTVAGYDALLFPLCGTAFLFGLLGTLLGEVINKLFRKKSST